MTAQMDEAPAGNAARGFRGQTKTEHADSRAPVEQTPGELHDGHVEAHDADRKRFATLRARLAMKGFELRRQADGSLLVIRWNLAKTLPDLDAAERFARQAGCRP